MRNVVVSLIAITVLLGVSGCSFQANTPAPVETLYTGKTYKDKVKGSLKQSRYKVQSGDTLYSIAWASGRDFKTLAKLNNLQAPYTIQPGQTLNLSGQLPKPRPVRPSTKPNKISKVQKPAQSQTVTKTKQKENAKSVDPKKSQGYASTTNSQFTNNKSTFDGSGKISRWSWPTKGKVIASFSSTAQGRQGLDIVAREGSPIVASAAGKVVYAGSALRGYGQLVIIKHNDEFLSAYAHNKKIFVKEKQEVKLGQKIAEMGSSDSDRVKLHFEIRYRGKPVDPMRYLPKL